MKEFEKRVEQYLEKVQKLALLPATRRKKRAAEGQRYGDIYERSVAAAIDVSVVFLLLNWLFTRITAELFTHIAMDKVAAIDPRAGLLSIISQLWDAQMIQWWWINFIIQIAITGVFYVSCQAAYHTTPGKWLLGLKIVRHGTEESPSLWRYVLRYVAYIPSCAPLMLGVFYAAFNKQHRAVHDYIAGTDVINTRPPGWYWAQIKCGFRYLKAKLTGSAPLEQPVGEPPAEQRHDDSNKSV